jgi:hypothetical protein
MMLHATSSNACSATRPRVAKGSLPKPLSALPVSGFCMKPNKAFFRPIRYQVFAKFCQVLPRLKLAAVLASSMAFRFCSLDEAELKRRQLRETWADPERSGVRTYLRSSLKKVLVLCHNLSHLKRT